MIKKLISLLIFGFLILLLMAACSKGDNINSVNIIENSSFEDGSTEELEGWKTEIYDKNSGAAELKIEEGKAPSGKKFATVINNAENDARYIQAVKVEEHKKYRLSCWIKTENVSQSGKGAILSIANHLESTEALFGTNEKWKQVEMYVETGTGVSSINVTIGVGGYSGLSTGKASFDDVKMQEVEAIPGGVSVAKVGDFTQNLDNSGNIGGEAAASPIPKNFIWMLFIPGTVIIAALCIVVKKNQVKENNASDEEKEAKA